MGSGVWAFMRMAVDSSHAQARCAITIVINKTKQMQYKVIGTVTFIDGVEKPTPTFTKRVFGILSDETHEFYFQCANARVDLLNDVKVGDLVRVSFTISCKTGESKEGKRLRFTTLNAASIEKLAVVSVADALPTQGAAPVQVAVTEQP